ncbi:MAG: hypothetical protein KDK39_13635 [Leptospiraceae bacterium]|nr:hypothetical protein [Leptospiraceae bacterium]
MDSSTRAELIRKGNQAFNEADYRTARELFTKADYKDGLIRIGDYYMYDRRLPLLAYGYYKRAGEQSKLNDLKRRMVSALGEWIGRDKIKSESLQSLSLRPPAQSLDQDADGMIPVQVSPELRQLAIEILQKNNQHN